MKYFILVTLCYTGLTWSAVNPEPQQKQDHNLTLKYSMNDSYSFQDQDQKYVLKQTVFSHSLIVAGQEMDRHDISFTHKEGKNPYFLIEGLGEENLGFVRFSGAFSEEENRNVEATINNQNLSIHFSDKEKARLLEFMISETGAGDVCVELQDLLTDLRHADSTGGGVKIQSSDYNCFQKTEKELFCSLHYTLKYPSLDLATVLP